MNSTTISRKIRVYLAKQVKLNGSINGNSIVMPTYMLPPIKTRYFIFCTLGTGISNANIFVAGYEIVQDVLMYREGTCDGGLSPGNCIGNAFDSFEYFIVPDIG